MKTFTALLIMTTIVLRRSLKKWERMMMPYSKKTHSSMISLNKKSNLLVKMKNPLMRQDPLLLFQGKQDPKS